MSLINGFLVLLGACPECYGFNREGEILGGRYFPSDEDPNYLVRITHEKCECGYDFGVIERMYNLYELSSTQDFM